MADEKNLSKDDLFLLLESYKNSVEMNTVISQQLTTILEILQTVKDQDANLEQNLKDKIDSAIKIVEKMRDKFEAHDKEDIKYFDKILNKLTVLYIGVGSIVLSLCWIIYQLIDKYELLHTIAVKLGVHQ